MQCSFSIKFFLYHDCFYQVLLFFHKIFGCIYFNTQSGQLLKPKVFTVFFHLLCADMVIDVAGVLYFQAGIIIVGIFKIPLLQSNMNLV